MPALKGKVYKYRNLSWYAWGGIICLHDESDGSQHAITLYDFARRAETLNEGTSRDQFPTERDAMISCVEHMLASCLEAKAQGDPTDPEVLAYLARHRVNRQAMVNGVALRNGRVPRQANLRRSLPTYQSSEPPDGTLALPGKPRLRQLFL